MPSLSTRFPRPPDIQRYIAGRDPTVADLLAAHDELTRWASGLNRELEELQAQLEQPASIGWSTENVTTTRSLNVSTATTGDVANALATLIEDLKKRGDLGK